MIEEIWRLVGGIEGLGLHNADALTPTGG